MYIGLHVKYRLFLSDLNETRIFASDFRKILKCQISWKSIPWEPSCSMQTERRTDMTKLIVFFFFAILRKPHKRITISARGSDTTTLCLTSHPVIFSPQTAAIFSGILITKATMPSYHTGFRSAAKCFTSSSMVTNSWRINWLSLEIHAIHTLETSGCGHPTVHHCSRRVERRSLWRLLQTAFSVWAL